MKLLSLGDLRELIVSANCLLTMSTRPSRSAPNHGIVSNMIVLPASVLDSDNDCYYTEIAGLITLSDAYATGMVFQYIAHTCTKNTAESSLMFTPYYCQHVQLQHTCILRQK